jgi:hypothetical protein
MTGGYGDGTTQAISSFLVDRSHLLLPIASQFRHEQPEFESAIRGNSMSPAIPHGARLRLRLSGQGPCHVGDVVFYLADDGYMVHRVVSSARRVSGQTYLLTEGDARFAPDPPVPCSRVLGTVVAVKVTGQWQPPGPPTKDPWHKRVTRALTQTILIAVMSLNVAAASRLAALLLILESRARLATRVMKREVRVALSYLEFVLDRARHPDVTYQKLDAGRLNELFPVSRRREVARAVSDSLGESDNTYFRNASTFSGRHRHLPRRIPSLDDLYPPNVAVLDFLAHSITRPQQEVLLDFPCGMGGLLVYARDLGLGGIYGCDNWSYLARSTAERFLQRFGIQGSVLVAQDDLPSLPVTIFTCIGFPFAWLVKNSLVWARPSVKYVLADRIGRPASLPGFRRTVEYRGLLTVFERAH